MKLALKIVLKPTSVAIHLTADDGAVGSGIDRIPVASRNLWPARQIAP